MERIVTVNNDFIYHSSIALQLKMPYSHLLGGPRDINIIILLLQMEKLRLKAQLSWGTSEREQAQGRELKVLRDQGTGWQPTWPFS